MWQWKGIALRWIVITATFFFPGLIHGIEAQHAFRELFGTGSPALEACLALIAIEVTLRYFRERLSRTRVLILRISRFLFVTSAIFTVCVAARQTEIDRLLQLRHLLPIYQEQAAQYRQLEMEHRKELRSHALANHCNERLSRRKKACVEISKELQREAAENIPAFGTEPEGARAAIIHIFEKIQVLRNCSLYEEQCDQEDSPPVHWLHVDLMGAIAFTISEPLARPCLTAIVLTVLLVVLDIIFWLAAVPLDT